MTVSDRQTRETSRKPEAPYSRLCCIDCSILCDWQDSPANGSARMTQLLTAKNRPVSTIRGLKRIKRAALYLQAPVNDYNSLHNTTRHVCEYQVHEHRLALRQITDHSDE